MKISVNGNIYRRHVDQIVRNHIPRQNYDDQDEYMEYDFDSNDDTNLQRPVVSPRRRIRREYPKRTPKPISRYGLSNKRGMLYIVNYD